MEPDTARARTVLLASGFQAARVPSMPNAASRLRVWAALPFQQLLAAVVHSVVKFPPA